MNKFSVLNKFPTVDSDQLSEVTGGSDNDNIFYVAGRIVGKGFYYFAKGASAIRG